MRIAYHPSSNLPRTLHYLTTLCFNDSIALDAGPIGLLGLPEEQAAIHDVVLTHAHIDHLATLPIFLENVYRLTPRPIAIHATRETIAALHAHVFNDCLFPTLELLNGLNPPFCTLHEIRPRVPFFVGGLQWEAVPLMHPTPCVGYRVRDERGAIVVATDTDDCPGLHELLFDTPRLRAVFLEASFPNSQTPLARASQHLTVGQFLDFAFRLPESVSIFAIHTKARFRKEISDAIRKAKRKNVSVFQAGQSIDLAQFD
ncbi:MBL fold metallo-hydrolase [Tuwongella immobilis]|uniref:Metallo-beta-lactamase domain-containing protein n=1 Tax=Tuwongella immobilis TaxID=692036 RepID=A0A6C2YI68_9BACT|nr:MBL fold metallo-hydrolase [Tuwongella immobilis]VIP01117.1 Metal-dependent hydrolase, beta-lactamase superfamily III OS=Singulisphaera acidiphila (strain ATCC BAA-1392 / DSM 18658 / VKM B-2454 / MOB10) GN=Sinac_3059 PE=4 SV=1: Lactamase_B_2 [Tuwongella immobilis]VTR97659.1 Metal-dependent hydrolase, beta-lactamase superfamily III OS=Singulisphaera acidiphila (strain ATCC BAA-1392 / DSM 18658 / VKM B-2454 / MOB10) GN=Sinac_3059 PE=4 SV=1: Lactamase_B_2 [Tuwongella immobilis]